MITKGYGHVGRPTNEERKNRKKKNIILITILIASIIALSSFVYIAFNSNKIDLSSLTGNSSTTSYLKIIVDGKEEESISLRYNSSKQLAVPSKLANQRVKWSSENSKLVNVNEKGLIKVTGKTVGITYIYATLENGKRGKLTVKVHPNDEIVAPLKDVYDNLEKEFKNDKDISKKMVYYNDEKYGYYDYKTNVALKKNGVMQSFAIAGNYIYYSQQQASQLGGYITKVSLDEIIDNGVDMYYGDNYAVLKDYGHVGNIDIETTDGKRYLWTQCGSDKHCRVPLSNIKFIGSKIGTTKVDGKNKIKAQEPSDVIVYNGVSYVAVEPFNNTVVTMGGKKSKPEFNVYDLDDYVASNGDNLPDPIYTFTKTIKNNKYSRQGIDVHGNYIYSYEGNKTSKTDDKGNPVKGIFITVYKLDGTVVINRLKVEYPDNIADWEPEGIKVYNGNLFIGMARIDKKTKVVTQHIFSIGKTVESLK